MKQKAEYIDNGYLDSHATEEEIEKYFFDLAGKMAPWYVQWVFRLVGMFGPEARAAFIAPYAETRRKHMEKKWN